MAESGPARGARLGVDPFVLVAERRPLLPALSRDRLAVAGLLVVATLAVLAIAAPAIAPFDPAAIDPVRRLELPGREHLLGTDQLGRDVLSRILFGARISLGASMAAAVLTVTLGSLVGTVAGWRGGIPGAILMRVVDCTLAFPSLLLALAICGALGTGIATSVAALSLVYWAGYARIVRSLVIAARARPYVEAARALGASEARILFRHVLPNVLPPVIVLAAIEMGELVLAFAALSFLGLGPQPPAPEWGAMLNDGREYLLTAPQLMILPGAAISLLVLGFNLLGDGIRDALDPRLS